MKSKKKLKIVLALTLAVALIAAIPCYATTQEQINIAVQEKEEEQTELVSTQERIDALEAQRADSESFLLELERQLTELAEDMTATEQEKAEVEAEITQTEAELAEARTLEQAQYEDMKLRIQYIYEENSSAGLLESLFSAESFSDFLNRAEQMDQLNQFDRDMLDSYTQTVNTIEENETRLCEERARIEDLQNRLAEQQSQVEAIYAAAYDELRNIQMNLSETETEKSALIAAIEAKEDELDQLIARKYAEDAAAQAAMEEAARLEAEAAAQAEAAAEQAPAAETYYEPAAAADPAPAEPAPAPEVSQPSGNTVYLGNFTLTAYCACERCCGKWAALGAKSASGATCVEGVTVAMGGVPFGTQLLINGHVYTVQDRGTPYGHVDIFFSTHAAASAFGLQHADVYQVN